MGVLAALLIGACGLPSRSTLQSPKVVEGESVPGVMRFSGTGGNNFLGYEIYYKLITSAEATPDPRHHDDLRAGFGRLSKDSGSCDGDRPPLVEVPDSARTENPWVELDVSAFRAAATGQEAGDEPVLRFSWQQQQEVRRGIEDADLPLRACRRFSTVDGYRPGDRDLSTAAAAAITARTGALIDLVAYAVSYGRDRGLPLYSAPLRIGRERLDLY